MTFASPHFSIFLVIIPTLVALFYWQHFLRRLKMGRAISQERWPTLIPSADPRRYWLRRGLFLVGLSLLIIAMMRPQYGQKSEMIARRNQNVIIALDTSLSMMTRDVAPSRFERAKQDILALLDNAVGDRIGLVVFSGRGQLFCPLTGDYAAVKIFLDDAQIGMMSRTGSDLEEALAVSAKGLGQNTDAKKVIVLFSDGEALEGNALKYAKLLGMRGITVFTIGVGTAAGEPIPILDADGRINSYKRNSKNEVVLSRLDRRGLVAIASATHGQYFEDDGQHFVAESLSKALAALEKQEIQEAMSKNVAEQYTSFALLSFLILVLEMGISGRKSSKKIWGFFVILLLILASAQNTYAFLGAAYDNNVQGIRALQHQEIKGAIEHFGKALSARPEAPELQFNLGDALFAAGDFEKAQDSFEVAAIVFRDPKKKARAFYNLGNLAYKTENYTEAITFYIDALKQDPSFRSAKLNLELARHQEREKKRSEVTGKSYEKKMKKRETTENSAPWKEWDEEKSVGKQLLSAVDELEKNARLQRAIRREKNGEERRDKDW